MTTSVVVQLNIVPTIEITVNKIYCPCKPAVISSTCIFSIDDATGDFSLSKTRSQKKKQHQNVKEKSNPNKINRSMIWKPCIASSPVLLKEFLIQCSVELEWTIRIALSWCKIDSPDYEWFPRLFISCGIRNTSKLPTQKAYSYDYSPRATYPCMVGKIISFCSGRRTYFIVICVIFVFFYNSITFTFVLL